MRQVFRIILDILREISDESAYKRHLLGARNPNIPRRSGVASATSDCDRIRARQMLLDTITASDSQFEAGTLHSRDDALSNRS